MGRDSALALVDEVGKTDVINGVSSFKCRLRELCSCKTRLFFVRLVDKNSYFHMFSVQIFPKVSPMGGTSLMFLFCELIRQYVQCFKFISALNTLVVFS